MSARLICLGMCAQDAIYHTIPVVPTKVLATNYSECGGGMAANADVAAARLGANVAYWGRVGDDALGARIIAELASEGVRVDHVRRVRGRTSPSAAILVDARGERLICAYNDPALDRDPAWLPLADIDAVDAVLADVRWPQGAAGVLDRAREVARSRCSMPTSGRLPTCTTSSRARHPWCSPKAGSRRRAPSQRRATRCAGWRQARAAW